MESLWIQAKSKTYSIYLGKGLSERIVSLLPKSYSAYLIITDDTVGPLHLDFVQTTLAKAAPVYSVTVPAGEASKSFDQYRALLDHLLELNIDRKSCVVALGGGVVGDLAGFVAATYLRGVGFIQMPTTLLAHDSSVGGKTGINHEKGKNLIGSFYHPDAVFYDTSFLSSLPDREWRSGFSELIKHSLLDSDAFFKDLKSSIPDFSSLTPEAVTPFLKRGIEVKAKIVETDEQENGVRAFLNLGHTLGHALEKQSGYGVLTHGEAVAIGMVFALELSEKWLNVALPVQELIDWLKALGLNTTVPTGLSIESIMDSMKRDKKRKGETIRFVLLKSIGAMTLEELPEAFIKDHLAQFMAE